MLSTAEANGASDGKCGANVAPTKKPAASSGTSSNTSQMRREIDLLTAEKATLLGELKHERELRQKQQQVRRQF